MPYPRRTTYSRRPYRKRAYTRRAPIYRTMRTIAKREVKIDNMKDHPLQWADFIFNGGNVNTTPTMVSLVRVMADELTTNAYLQVKDWPSHNTNDGSNIFQARYMVTFAHYQLRFEQDSENLETSNTFRTLFYSYKNTYADDPVPVMSGTDIDHPPNTEFIKSMYFDRIKALHPGTTEITTDDTEGTPGSYIIKGSKRLGAIFTMYSNGSSYINWDDGNIGDIRWEAQSDTVGDGLQLYGFIRVYYRRLV